MTTNRTVPAGAHSATVVESYLSNTSKGTPCLKIVFEVEGEGRVTWTGFFTDRAVEQARKALSALGFDLAEAGFDLARINGTRLLVGRPASIVVEEEDDEKGRTWTRVRWVNKPVEKLGDDDVAALSAHLRKQAEEQQAQSESDTPF
jgi:hypothetical protein